MKQFKTKRTPHKNLTVLHNGGGTQSGTLIEMIHDGKIERPDVILQADTGDEPAYIYKQWERDRALMNEIGIPYAVVKNGSMVDDLYGGGRFAAMPLFTRQLNGKRGKRKKQPKAQLGLSIEVDTPEDTPLEIAGFGVSAQIKQDGKLKRQCTSNYKIEPIEKEIRTILLELGLATERKNGAIVVKKNVYVESWLGYTMDELERVKDSAHNWHYFRYPLIELRMTKQDCIQWLSDNNKPPRLSSFCKRCPLIGNKQMRELRDNDPSSWGERIQFDRDLRDPNSGLRIAATAKGELYIHPEFIPLEEVDIDGEDTPSLMMCSNVGCMT